MSLISHEYSCLFKNMCTTGINCQRFSKTNSYSIITYAAQQLIFTYLELIAVMTRDLFLMRVLIYGTTYQKT